MMYTSLSLVVVMLKNIAIVMMSNRLWIDSFLNLYFITVNVLTQLCFFTSFSMEIKSQHIMVMVMTAAYLEYTRKLVVILQVQCH